MQVSQDPAPDRSYLQVVVERPVVQMAYAKHDALPVEVKPPGSLELAGVPARLDHVLHPEEGRT